MMSFFGQVFRYHLKQNNPVEAVQSYTRVKATKLFSSIYILHTIILVSRLAYNVKSDSYCYLFLYFRFFYFQYKARFTHELS